MANLVATTYGKRPPLATLSDNVPITNRQSKRLRVDSSIENCHESGVLAPFKIFVEECQLQGTQVPFPIVAASSTSCSGSPELLLQSTVLLQTKPAAIEPSKRTQKVPKSRAPKDVLKTKKKMTLQMHVQKYRSTHEIE